MVNLLETAFPRLQRGNYLVTSPPTNRYNCIAWSMGEDARWWWPVGPTTFYWPDGVPREETLTAFETAFSSHGFVRCEGSEQESACEKIALFADANQLPTHAARQLDSGRWTSKLGEMDDIEHTLGDLEGDVYGTVVLFMKRLRPGLNVSAFTPSPLSTEPIRSE